MAAEVLAVEAPYGMDDEMKAWSRAFWLSESSGRPVRALEVARRLSARAGATWPAHSFALARLRLDAATSLHNVRHYRRTGAPTEEDTCLLRCVCDALVLRGDAGTLLRCTPSENAFDLEERACADGAAFHPAGSDLDYKPDELGYKLLCGTVALLANELTTGDATPSFDFAGRVRVLLRLLAFIESARLDALQQHRGGVRRRRDAQGSLPLDPTVRFAEEAQLMRCMDLLFERLVQDGAYRDVLARAVPRELLHQLRTAWMRVKALLKPDVMQRICAAFRVSDAARDAHVQAQSARWTPRPCALCGSLEAEPRQWKLCSRCGAAAYCCKEHQAAHWVAHRTACGAGGAAGGS